MGSTIGKIATGLVGAIPGIGPLAQGLISGGVGAAAGAFGKSGNQGGQQGTSNQKTTQNIDQTSTTTEDPQTALLRKLLQGQIGQGLNDAKKPVYGDNEVGGFLSQLNDLTSASMNSLKNNLGAAGASNSGRFLQSAQDAQGAYRQQATGFLGQLPLLNRQYKDNQISSLLGLGNNLVASGPRSTHTTGQTTGTTEGNFSQTATGPSFLKGLAGSAGGFLGDLSGRLLNGVNFGNPKSSGGPSYGPMYGWDENGNYQG